jgi:hypothetical protein
MNTAAPSWMTNGIPAIDKGKVTGYWWVLFWCWKIWFKILWMNSNFQMIISTQINR